MVWLQGLLCGGLAACAPATALLLTVLLAPALAMLAFERKPGRPVTRTMFLFGLSATVFPILALWNVGHTVDAAFTLATDPRTLAIAWGAAGGGWLLTEIVPIMMRLVLVSALRVKRQRLHTMRDRCAAEWGLESAQLD